MPQYARPTSDTSAGSWSPPPLFEKVGGSTPNDATIIHGAGDNPCVLALTPLATPQAGTVTLRVRARQDPSNPDAGITAELLSGGIVVASRNLTPITTTLATFAFALTTEERAAITSWADLAVRLTATALPPDTVHYASDPVHYAADPVVFGGTP